MKWRFWRKDNTLQNLDPHIAAFWVLQQMAGRKHPFDEWRPPDAVMSEYADAFVEICVWAYQLSIFLDCVERKFGLDVAELVKSHLLTLMNKNDPDGMMQRYLDAVQSGRALPERELFFAGIPAIQVDCNVAKAFLATAAEAEDVKAAVFPILGNSLTLGRISAEARFSRLADLISFRPEAVFGLRKADEIPIQWSDSPGCFESHLKRRHNNPLFPAERRTVSSSEIAEARARDLADLQEFRTRLVALLESIVGLPDQGEFMEIFKRWETAVDLLVRSAEVGGIAIEEKAPIQGLCDEIAETLRGALHNEERAPLTLNEIMESWWAHSEASTNELLAQIGRSDTPISAADAVPTLLSGDADTVRLFVEKTKDAGKRPGGVYEESLRLISNAREEGYSVPEAEEKLAALQSLATG